MQELGGQTIGPSQPPTVLERLESGRLAAPRAPSPSCRTSDLSSWRAELARVIEGEILPRLLLAHAAEPTPGKRKPLAPLEPLDLAELATRLIGEDAARAADYVSRLHAGGRSTHELLIDLLAPAAAGLRASLARVKWHRVSLCVT